MAKPLFLLTYVGLSSSVPGHVHIHGQEFCREPIGGPIHAMCGIQPYEHHQSAQTAPCFMLCANTKSCEAFAVDIALAVARAAGSEGAIGPAADPYVAAINPHVVFLVRLARERA